MIVPSSGDRRDSVFADLLRLMVITDAALAAPRSIDEVVDLALAGGARTIQLRDKESSAASLLETARRILPMVRAAGGILIVNDRVDVAIASESDGVHLGPDDIPVAAVRAVVPRPFLIGYSADSPEEARRAEDDGADYIGCGSVWITSTKDVGSEAIGLARLDDVARSVTIPVIAIGGITVDRAAEVARTSARGVAVVGAIMRTADPTDATRRLLAAIRRAPAPISAVHP
jgi:thiamine-phosphate pyrophosphorylase